MKLEEIILKVNNIIDADYSDVSDLLIGKNIVAIYQGRCEAGPRALGNRSILYDPRDPNAKDHVNKIKKREWFRPFAGSMMLEYAHEWFDMAGLDESPFMSYALEVLPNKKHLIPGIIHVDDTCRLQTVTRKQNYHYYNLIESFYQKTDVPIIFNTSFNLGGETLVETIDDAIDTLKRSEIEYLFLPEIMKLVIEENV
jgi:carbamoyltransferase